MKWKNTSKNLKLSVFNQINFKHIESQQSIKLCLNSELIIIVIYCYLHKIQLVYFVKKINNYFERFTELIK